MASTTLSRTSGKAPLDLGLLERGLERPEARSCRSGGDEERVHGDLFRGAAGERADEAAGTFVESASGQERRHPGQTLSARRRSQVRS